MATRIDSLHGPAWLLMDAGQASARSLPRGGVAAGPVSDWLVGIRAGDQDAFNAFYDAFSGRLYRYLFSILPGDEALVRDAFQDTMLRAIRYAKPMRSEADAWRWLTRLGRSALYDLLRKRRRESGREQAWTPPLSKPDVAEERLQSALDVVLDRLSPEDRQLIDAFYFQRQSQTHMAGRFGTTRKAIESRLARLREKMRNEMKEVMSHE